MVPHEHAVAPRKAVAAVFAMALWAAPSFGETKPKRVFADDPLLQEPAPRPVQGVATRHIDDIYDFLYNSFATPRNAAKTTRGGPRPALDVNTLGDVPDGAWYTRRHYYRRMSIDELKRGPGNSTPPSPHGAWRIISAKSDGFTPGFAIEDEHHNRYLLKFDHPGFPELASAADVIGSKVFYALGYYTPENYIVHFRREQFCVNEGVTWRDASGKKRALTEAVIDELLKDQPQAPDGSYRALASRWIHGKLAGPFNYEGMRTDDPNDIVPHEDRRELRGLRVFASWVNHQDTKSINSMDSLVEENGIAYLRHYLLDFGSILGSDGAHAKQPWSGHQYTIDNKAAAVQMVTLGLFVPRWARADYPKFTAAGLFDAWSFDPVTWKPNYPNPAFLRMDDEDAFWAAKQVAAFTDAEIRALVETGEYTDPNAAAWIADCLIKRRDKIVEAWFSGVVSLDRFRVADGTLVFDDLRARAGAEYAIHWARWDGTGDVAPLPHPNGSRLPSFGDAPYLVATVTPVKHAWQQKGVTVYMRRCRSGAEVVAIDR